MIQNSRREKMGKKYLDTKEGSLEQSVLGVWQTAIDESDARVDGRTKQYKEHRAKLEAARQRREEKKLNKEEVELDEASVMVDLENDNPKLMKDIKKMGIKVKDLGDSGNPGYNEYELTGSPAALKKGGKKFGWDQQVEKVNEGSKEEYQKFFNAAMKKFGIDSPADLKSDEEKKKFFDYVDKNYKGEKDEEVQKLHKELFGLEEGKMSQLHQLIKDKKSAEEIAKIMKVDAKTIKALMAGYMSAGHMPESYEIGTDEYRKHTEDVTPGENGEWVDTVNKKNESMREALAKVWGVNESKKDLTKEVKDGKTMTGKKIAKVDVEPKIMEKKK